MNWLLKSVGSGVLGMIGWWLGSFVGFGTALFMNLILSVVGWYLTKYLCQQYLEI
jgi:hypothetical protein